MSRTYIYAVAIITAMTLTGSFYEAFASNNADMGYMQVRQEARLLASQIEIQGLLSCDQSASGGKADICALKITENGTGKVYGIAQNNDAMKLIGGNGGSKNVAIQGRLAEGSDGGQIITIQNLKTL